MRFFRSMPVQQTIPPTDAEMLEDRESEFRRVLSEYGLQHIQLKMKSHENDAGLHLFVRLYNCSPEHWIELHGQSMKIKKRLRARGMNVVEVFYSLCS